MVARDHDLHSAGSRVAASTVDAAEVARFDEQAPNWWDEQGPMRMLHRLNPVRLAYIRDWAVDHFDRDEKDLRCLSGLHILDIGCGAGVLSEPLARLGGTVLGIDPSTENIEAARRHAAATETEIEYRVGTAEALADTGARFDMVLAMEVVEHVADVDLFVRRAADMVRPGGLLFVSTINRTLRSFALAIVAAEYILGWLPRGTHRWEKFITPEELGDALRRAGLRRRGSTGVIYNILNDEWQLSPDMAVNYMIVAARRAETQAL